MAITKIYCGGQNGLVEYYKPSDGTWTDITIPGMTGYSVKNLKVLPNGDIWASFVQTPLTTFKVAYWNGVSWSVYTSPTTTLSTDSGFIVPVAGDGLYILAVRIYHNSFANYLYHLTFDGVTWTQKWAGNPATFKCTLLEFDGVAGNDLYFTGAAAWVDVPNVVCIWHWDGGTMTIEAPGSMSPNLPVYPPFWVPSPWISHAIKAVSSDLVVVAFAYNSTMADPEYRIYAGKMGAWTQEVVIPKDADQEVITKYYYEHMDKDSDGQVFLYTENYSQPTTAWMRVRSPSGVWSRIPMHDGLIAIQTHLGCAGAGAIMAHVGGGASGFKDVVLTLDGGSSFLGWDRVNTYYCVVIDPGNDPPNLISGPSSIQNDYILRQ